MALTVRSQLFTSVRVVKVDKSLKLLCAHRAQLFGFPRSKFGSPLMVNMMPLHLLILRHLPTAIGYRLPMELHGSALSACTCWEHVSWISLVHRSPSSHPHQKQMQLWSNKQRGHLTFSLALSSAIGLLGQAENVHYLSQDIKRIK